MSKIFFTADFSQIEIRVMAHLSQEKELINAFHNEVDPYSLIAVKLLGLNADPKTVKQTHPKHRDVAKTAGLSILYGTGPNKLREVLAKELGLKLTYNQAKEYIEEYRNGLPGVKAFKEKLERALSSGGTYYNLLGRPFYIASNEDIYMKGLNTLVQGSASDLVLWSQTEFVIPALRELGVDFKHRMLIHDEVVIELVADEAQLVAEEVIIPAMTLNVAKALNLSIPLKVEYNISRIWEKP